MSSRRGEIRMEYGELEFLGLGVGSSCWAIAGFRQKRIETLAYSGSLRTNPGQQEQSIKQSQKEDQNEAYQNQEHDKLNGLGIVHRIVSVFLWLESQALRLCILSGKLPFNRATDHAFCASARRTVADYGHALARSVLP